MKFFDVSINVTRDGVYRPPTPWIDVIGCILIFCVLGWQLYHQEIPVATALGLAALPVAVAVFKRVRYGTRGMPYIRLSADELVVSLPADSRGSCRFKLEELGSIQIYGPSKGRKYRFLRKDGSFVDLMPYFGEKAEQAVIGFLMSSLPSHIVVKQCEPQTVFEQIRGDGP